MSIDYLSQNLFNTCGTGYNLGCGGSYSAGNLFGGLGNSIWSLCSTYGSTCNTKAGAIAQKRAIKQMWGQVGFALGERAVNWILNLGAGFIQSAITNAGNESPTAEADLNTQKAELDKKINEKLNSIEATENDYKGKKAEELKDYQKLQTNIDCYTRSINTLNTEITDLRSKKKTPQEKAPETEQQEINNFNNDIDRQISEKEAEIKNITEQKTEAENKCKEIKQNLEKTKTEIDDLIKKREKIQKELDELENSAAESEKDTQDRKELKDLLGDVRRNPKDRDKIEKFIEKYDNASSTVQKKYENVYSRLLKKLDKLDNKK